MPSRPSTAHAERTKDAVLGAFFADVRRHAVLSREEEHDLAVRYKQTGDRHIADKLVVSNLRLVVMIARQFGAAKRHRLLDLVQEGSIGLAHALTKFDPTRGYRFASYASHWIRAYIMKFMITNHHLVKLGTTQEQRKVFFGQKKARAKLERNGGTVTTEQLAAELGVDTDTLVEMEMRLADSTMSLDAPTRIGDDQTSRDFAASNDLRPDVLVEERDFRDAAHGWIHTFGALLEGRDRIIFDKRLIAEDPVTLADLAAEWGVTRERVRQVEEKLKERLKMFLRRSSA